MTLEGYTFDFMKVAAKDDALLYKGLAGVNRVVAGFGNEFKQTISGLNVYVGTGAAIIEGRLIKVTADERVTIPANATGFIALTIDLTKTNTFEGIPGSTGYKAINNQIRVEFVPTLVQQDIHRDGKVYTYPLSSIRSTGTLVTSTPFYTGIEYMVPTLGNGFTIADGVAPRFLSSGAQGLKMLGRVQIPAVTYGNSTYMCALPPGVSIPAEQIFSLPALTPSTSGKCIVTVRDVGVHVHFNNEANARFDLANINLVIK